MEKYCEGCGESHEDFNWLYRQYEVSEDKYAWGFFCRRFHKPTRFVYHSQKCDWEREKHIKDITQPFEHDEPNPKFAKMYQDEPDKLKKIYSRNQLKKVGLEKI